MTIEGTNHRRNWSKSTREISSVNQYPGV